MTIRRKKSCTPMVTRLFRSKMEQSNGRMHKRMPERTLRSQRTNSDKEFRASVHGRGNMQMRLDRYAPAPDVDILSARRTTIHRPGTRQIRSSAPTAQATWFSGAGRSTTPKTTCRCLQTTRSLNSVSQGLFLHLASLFHTPMNILPSCFNMSIFTRKISSSARASSTSPGAPPARKRPSAMR